jgi:hypothetical protein
VPRFSPIFFFAAAAPDRGLSVSNGPTPRERLNALIEEVLDAAEARAAAGDLPSARELNGLRRLIERQEADDELAALRRLTTDEGRA